MDWKRELVIAHLVKQKVAEVDIYHLWDNTLPELAASEDRLISLEKRLGYALDSQHRAFLLHANGWRAFSQHIDVFGADDFEGGPLAARAIALIESLEPLYPLCGLDKQDVLPIAVSSDDIDVMVMARPHTETPGKVLWLAGGLIDVFPGFDEWFLAMVDYIREDYQRLLKRNFS
ncbi:SMI1/KNR4 family protein [Achromobacter sp. Marseille-Q0513]|uniref:SMI1/KNR4 family protein n=1 Tax=Achromobacter sp. Marseille-Q0513 TaxID=2829161 RepID=UPI001B965F37|nr:SMI1/KNR4 family protein [Achromobacter sp. Marseille-Q0513]MBR8657004.1 SMI1/KNR4 family protein [Achromobacter sp. Marseille-Q0513]